MKPKSERIQLTVVYELDGTADEERMRDIENYLRRLHQACTVRGAGPGGVWKITLDSVKVELLKPAAVLPDLYYPF